MESVAKASNDDRYHVCGFHVKIIATVLAVNAIGYCVLATVGTLVTENHVDWSVIGGYVLVFVAHASVLGAIWTRKPGLLYIYFVTQGLYIVNCAVRVAAHLLVKLFAHSHKDAASPSPQEAECGLGTLKGFDLPIYVAYFVFAICCFLLNIRVREALILEARSTSSQKAQGERIA